MHILKIVFIGFLCILMANCSDTDASQAAILQEQIVGSWDLSALTIDDCNNPNSDLSFEFTDTGCGMYKGVEVCSDARFVFSSDGTYRTTGGITTEDDDFLDTNAEGTWSVDGNKITICEGGDSCEVSIASIIDNNLTLSYTDEENCELHMNYTKG